MKTNISEIVHDFAIEVNKTNDFQHTMFALWLFVGQKQKSMGSLSE